MHNDKIVRITNEINGFIFLQSSVIRITVTKTFLLINVSKKL